MCLQSFKTIRIEPVVSTERNMPMRKYWTTGDELNLKMNNRVQILETIHRIREVIELYRIGMAYQRKDGLITQKKRIQL